MAKRVLLRTSLLPPVWPPELPNTYVPPRMDAGRSGWNKYYPTTWQQLKDYCAGTGVSRPAVIYLDPAITYTPATTSSGEVIIVAATGDEDNGWLYIMPLEADYSNLPSEGTRIATSYSSYMPEIKPRGYGCQSIIVAKQARRVRLVGLHLTHSAENDVDASMVYLGGAGGGLWPADETEWADEIVMDRCWVHGPENDWTKNYREGVRFVGTRMALIESRVEYQRGGETKSVWLPWASYRITVWNNYLDGISQSILSGGTTNLWDGQITDVDVRYNEMTKSHKWDSSDPGYVGRTGSQMKCHVELKHGTKWYFYGNYLNDLYRNDSNQGWAFQISGEGIAHRLEDITIEWNDSRKCCRGISISPGFNGAQLGPSGRMLISQNLLQCTQETILGSVKPLNINVPYSPSWNPTYQMMRVDITQNTFIGYLTGEPADTANLACNFTENSGGGACSDLRITRNVTDGGIYGYRMEGTVVYGDTAMDNFAASWDTSGNVSWNASLASLLPSNFTNVDSIADIGFAQTSDPNGSWQISGAYSALGCDYVTLMSNTAIARSGVRL